MADVLVYVCVSLVLVLALFSFGGMKSAWKLSQTYYRRRKAVKRLPKLTEGHWFWGALFLLRPDQATLLWVTNWISENKVKITGAWFGPVFPAVGIVHPDAVPKILKEPKHRLTYNILIPWLGDGLLISQGHKWFRNRRLLTPAFHYEILKPYVAVYNSCFKVMLKKWSKSAEMNEPVKLFETMSLMSLDIIQQCAFSYKSDCQTLGQRHPYISAVYELIELTAERFFTPLYTIDWIYFLTPAGRRYRRAADIAHKHSERVIEERKKKLKEEKMEVLGATEKRKRYLDFLDILLTARDDDGNGLTDSEVRNEVDTFMFEGHDTTTSGMCWTLYCLAKHPEHQVKIREEVTNILMGREWLEYDDLKDLKYTQWCIKEALRLYPPVFVFFRESSEDIEFDGYTIPTGSLLFVLPYVIHRCEEIWKNPEEFDPLRFHPSNVEDRHPYAYIPFSAGQRNCIGQNFALNEQKIVIASIIYRFSLSLVEDHEVEMVPKVVLRTTNDIKVMLTPCN